MNTDKKQSASAGDFAKRWGGKGYEKGDTQKFWLELLQKVYGVEDPYTSVEFEDKVMVDSTNYMDVYLPATRVLIEQKGIHKSLGAPVPQSDGSLLTPFQQAKKYIVGLPLSRHPRWVVTCNFAEFWVYDMEQPNGEPQKIRLKDLEKEYYRLQFLVDKSEHITKELRVSMQAGEIVGRIYEALLKQYNDNSPEALRWLNILCVRIVFCLYAEDAGVFAHDQFHNYLGHYDAEDLRNALERLFETLNTPIEQRSKYLKDDLQAFPYTNGGLFEEKIEIPQFTEELKETLLQNASLDFDWSEISPTIFGAVFESTLNPETRRSGGMHYTSIENIHKVIDPLFMDDLWNEFHGIVETPNFASLQKRNRKLLDFQDKLARLTFLDPACGSGNFLTETYLSLRRLENEVINARHHGQSFIGFEETSPIKVSINQFYGIEINDFAVTVATTALWISEAQMLRETEKIIHRDIDFLPLKNYANIKEGNALRMDWSTLEKDSSLNAIYVEKLNVYKVDDFKNIPYVEETTTQYNGVCKELNVVTKEVVEKELPGKRKKAVVYDYIIGNPPFVGYTYQTKEQKDDLKDLMKDFGNNIDYVAGWYYKAAQIIQGTNTKCALVSTNSITQGEQVAAIWKPLFERFGIHFDFAYRTFRWDSEASLKAHVHCVIIGFSHNNNQSQQRVIYDKGNVIEADNICPYLINSPTIFIQKRKRPLADIPQMCKGSQPTDGGNFILSEEERDRIIDENPEMEKYIRPFIGANEFIKGKRRYCLWLVNANPSDLRHSAEVLRRVQAVRESRLASPKSATRKWADFPMLFTEIRQPSDMYILVPSTSSERRRYVPIGFVSPLYISSNANLIVPNASLYHFGILTSNVHMAWMRVVCGRLKSDYRYSNDIVYNNFPWPNPAEKQMAIIEQTAQRILDARTLYPDSSLADLYDERTMPPELRKAHQENDKAVMQAYGFNLKWLNDDTEAPIVEELFKMYLLMG